MAQQAGTAFQGTAHVARLAAILQEMRKQVLPSVCGEVYYTDGVASYMFMSNDYHLVTLPAEQPLTSMVEALKALVEARKFMVPGLCDVHQSGHVLPTGQLQCKLCGEVYDAD